jgi:hypothetical protein
MMIRLKTETKTIRVLGVAFLLQFITSISSGVFFKSAWFVPEDMSATMLKIAANPALLRANILVDLLTALGVTFLGAILYLTLRKQNEKIALTALGFYILEAALLAASRMETFALLRFSQEYAAAGQPAELLLLGQVAYEAMDFAGNTLHMLAFCLGAVLFYFLLVRSGVVPCWLSLWGLITIFPMLIGTIAQMFGYSMSFFFYVPYVPFELVIGVWILIKGTEVGL